MSRKKHNTPNESEAFSNNGVFDINKLEEKDRMKYEIAEELGLLDRVLESGWKSLSAKETGRIGGMINKRKREANS